MGALNLGDGAPGAKGQKFVDAKDDPSAHINVWIVAHDHTIRGFAPELKERFCRWFNKYHGRRGTLWQDRSKSVLGQDGEALQMMAAYLDLNPLRAGLVDGPKNYRWCGYAEAVAGSKRARVGIFRVMESALDGWNKEAGERYRRLLLNEGIERFEEKPSAVGEDGGKLTSW